MGGLELSTASAILVGMKRTERELTTFKVKQAIGSMAIEGIHVSRQTRETMKSVAAGNLSAADVKRELNRTGFYGGHFV